MATFTLSKSGSTENKQEDLLEAGEHELVTIEKIDSYIDECRSLCENRLINNKTHLELEKMWLELRAEKKVDYMRENIRFLYETLSDAHDYETEFRQTLDEGVRDGWIVLDNKEEWMDRFYDPNVLEWNRKKWLKKTFPEYIKNWQEVSKDRKDLINLAKKMGIQANEIPEMNDITNEKVFFGLHYRMRVHKIGKVKALLIARQTQKETLLRFTEKELNDWAKAGWIHASKVGPWMLRVMNSENPEQFTSEILYPFKDNWIQARERFDAVAPSLKKRSDIRGFTPIKADKFLLLDYDQRIAYLDEAESRLESNVNEKGKLAGLRLDIRHAMDTRDWLGAEELLGIAQGMAPDDKAVRSMGRYLALHRTDTLDNGEDTIVRLKNKGNESLQALRSIVSKLPTNMATMTEKALLSPNPNVIKRLWQIFYNRHWLIANGFSTTLEEQKESRKEENFRETKKSIANGHGAGFARQTIKDATANDAGIRDECNEPQIVYTNRTGISEVYEGIARNANNEKFGYWTTLVDDEVPYELLREAVLNHMYHIKQHAKTLRESGMIYSSYGSTFSVN